MYLIYLLFYIMYIYACLLRVPAQVHEQAQEPEHGGAPEGQVCLH